jgi:hypothetical protein
MALTTITITGTFTRPNGEPDQGTITATLSEVIQNGTTIIEPTPILGTLNTEGKLVNESLLPFTLVANNDTATEPAGSTYNFLVQLDNAPVRSFSAVVPHTAVEGKIDLSVLDPA